MPNFYSYQHIGFSPRVRPLRLVRVGPDWCAEFRVECKVVGRDAAHTAHGYTFGRIVLARPGSLYRKRRTLRGTFGRLEYSDRMTAAELAALPVAPRNG